MKPLCGRVLLITSFISSVAITSAMPQQAVANPSLAERATAGNPAETRIPDLLRQFDDSLEALVTRVSPAVVQITVTRFGPQDGKSEDGVSLIVRQRAPGPDTQSRSFQAGDVIHSLNNTPVKSVEQLRAALHQLKAGDPVVLQVERQRKLHYVAFDME